MYSEKKNTAPVENITLKPKPDGNKFGNDQKPRDFGFQIVHGPNNIFSNIYIF